MSWEVDFLPESYRRGSAARRSWRLRLIAAGIIIAGLVLTEMSMQKRLRILRRKAMLARERAEQVQIGVRMAMNHESRRIEFLEKLEALTAPVQIPRAAAMLDSLLVHRPPSVRLDHLKWSGREQADPSPVAELWLAGFAPEMEQVATYLERLAKDPSLPPLEMKNSPTEMTAEGRVQRFQFQLVEAGAEEGR